MFGLHGKGSEGRDAEECCCIIVCGCVDVLVCGCAAVLLLLDPAMTIQPTSTDVGSPIAGRDRMPDLEEPDLIPGLLEHK